MLRVPVHKLEPTMVLARPIQAPDQPGQILLPRDQPVPPDLAVRLEKLGVREVWVRNRDLEFLEEVFDDELGERQRAVYAQVRRNFERVMAGTTVELELEAFTTSIADLFSHAQASSCGIVLLEKLGAFDNYLMTHSTNVCYLALLVALRLEDYFVGPHTTSEWGRSRDIQELGLGCLLHDVGKMRIPPEILHKPGKLTVDEMEVMKLHPVFGHEMVRGQVSPSAAQVVLNHHQRWDGRGYPARVDRETGGALPNLSGRQIHLFARIATLADVYDAATAQRCYSPAKPPVQALHEMRTWCRGFFDPVIEQKFFEIIPPFPIGQIVTLSNGLEAAVVDFNPSAPVRPKVQPLRRPVSSGRIAAEHEEIDLACECDLSIAEVDGFDVRAFLASQETRELAGALG